MAIEQLTEEQVAAIWKRLEDPFPVMFCDPCTISLTHEYYKSIDGPGGDFTQQCTWYLLLLASFGEL